MKIQQSKTKARIATIQLAYHKARIGETTYGYKFILEKSNIGKAFSKKDLAYIDNLLLELKTREKEIDIYIQNSLIKWKQTRIQIIINSILKVALVEVIRYPSLSIKIIINDYLEIARFLAGEEVVKFCNAVLDQAIKNLKQIKTIKKC